MQGARGPTGPKGDKGDPGVSSYSAGTGLALSGNTFSVAGNFQLPQGCSAGQSPYLLGVPLSHPWSCFDPANGNESCPSGKFQNGVDANGDITCATPSSGSSSLSSAVDSADRTGIPDDETQYAIASVNVAAGTYLVVGKGVIESAENVDIFKTVNCYLGGDTIELGSDTLNANNTIPFGALTDIVTVPAGGGDITMTCEADSGADGIEVHDSRLVAVKIG